MPARTKTAKATKETVEEKETVEAPKVETSVEEGDTHDDHEKTNDDGENKRKGKSKQLNYDDILGLIDDQLTHNEEEKTRLKEGTRVLREVRKFITRSDQQQKKVKTKPKQMRKPTGFARPRGLSEEMITFLNKNAGIKELDVQRKDDPVASVKIEKGCKLARNELTKALCYHFKNNNMRKDPEDQRKIYLDDATRKLFRIDIADFKKGGGNVSDNNEPVITYFDLQKYLPVHCLKDE
jgi:hypothetical protein